MKVEVFGSGCPRCKQTEKVMKMAVEELGLNAVVEKVTDMMAMNNSGGAPGWKGI